jgi:hypothetical protein
MQQSTLIEGWHTDPFGLHDARWLSAGEPTKLVRDGSIEFYEPVPEVDATVIPQPITTELRIADGEDLNRCDRRHRSQRDAMGRAAASILLHTSG